MGVNEKRLTALPLVGVATAAKTASRRGVATRKAHVSGAQASERCCSLRAQPPRALPRRSLESDERVRPGNEPRELQGHPTHPWPSLRRSSFRALRPGKGGASFKAVVSVRALNLLVEMHLAHEEAREATEAAAFGFDALLGILAMIKSRASTIFILGLAIDSGRRFSFLGWLRSSRGLRRFALA